MATPSAPPGYRHWVNSGRVCLAAHVGHWNCPCVACAKLERPDAIEGPVIGDTRGLGNPVGLWLPVTAPDTRKGKHAD